MQEVKNNIFSVYKKWFSPSKNACKDLYPSYKTDLDL